MRQLPQLVVPAFTSVSNPAIQAGPLLQQSYTPDGLIASLTDANGNTAYSSVFESDVPIVVQHTRLNSRRAEVSLLSTIAYAER